MSLTSHAENENNTADKARAHSSSSCTDRGGLQSRIVTTGAWHTSTQAQAYAKSQQHVCAMSRTSSTRQCNNPVMSHLGIYYHGIAAIHAMCLLCSFLPSSNPKVAAPVHVCIMYPASRTYVPYAVHAVCAEVTSASS